MGGRTFADTVAEHRAARDAADAASEATPAAAATPASQAASAPTAPPVEPTADPDAATEVAGLLGWVQDLLDGGGTGQATPNTVPTLDRPAGAGDIETETVDLHAMEALMAQSLLVRIPAEPEEVATTLALSAVAEAPGTEGAALTALQGAVAELAPLASAPAGPGAMLAADGGMPAEAGEPAPGAHALDAASMTATASTPASSRIADGSAAADAGGADAAPLLQALQDAAPMAESIPAVDTRAGDVEPEALGAGANVPVTEVAGPLESAPDAPAVLAVPEADHASKHAASDTVTAAATAASAPMSPEAPMTAQGPAVRTEVATGGAMTSQIANTVQTAVLRGEHEVRLVLNPPELGRVEIQITETAGGIRVHMLADQPAARDLIERQLPLLQQALSARDVRVERMEVGRSGDANAAQAWSNSQGSNDGQRQRGQQDGGTPAWSPLAAMGLGVTEQPRATRRQAAGDGGLDVMA